MFHIQFAIVIFQGRHKNCSCWSTFGKIIYGKTNDLANISFPFLSLNYMRLHLQHLLQGTFGFSRTLQPKWALLRYLKYIYDWFAKDWKVIWWGLSLFFSTLTFIKFARLGYPNIQNLYTFYNPNIKQHPHPNLPGSESNNE